jgi:DHA1 family tetracycline resistance protein-like MFS transporter
VALDLVGFGLVFPILPLYSERFHASPTTIGLLVASFSIAQLALSPVWGRVSDQVGRKPVLLVSLVGTCVGGLLTGLAGSLWVLFLARVLDGASGASVSVAQAAVTDVAAPDQRARLLGLLGAAFGVGFVVGPALGSLAALGGPRVPFVLAGVIAGANALVATRRLPETHPLPERRPRRDSTVEWRRRGLLRLVLVAFLSLVAFSAFEATFSLLGQRRLGLGLASSAAVFTVIGLLIVLVQVALVHPVVRRLGEGGALRLGLVLDAVGLAVLADLHSFAILALAVVALTVGQGLVMPTLAAMVAGRVPADRRGGALGVQQAAGGLARVVGPVVGGVAFAQLGPPAPYLIGAGLAVLAVGVLAAPSGRSTDPVVARLA